EEAHPDTEHVGLIEPGGELLLGIRCRRVEASHHREPARVPARHLDGVVVSFTGPEWWHDHRAVDADFVHGGDGLLAAEAHLRRTLASRRLWPRTLRSVRLPEMHLRVSNEHARLLP